MRRRRTTLGGVVALVLVAVVAGWLLFRTDPAPRAAAEPLSTPSPTPTATPPPVDECATSGRGAFVPTSVSIAGAVRSGKVISTPRDANDVPGVLPVSNKRDFAWDRGGVEAGSRHGQVLLNTHTWPDGTAMGNRLLATLDVGAKLVLRGAGRTACYTVTKAVEVTKEAGYPGYGATDGPPQVVIVVCSGKRLGPGDWSHRTLFIAQPIA